MTDTAKTLRDAAAKMDQERADSFDRCDTDGFLSQWANGINAQLNRAEARIIENGGTATFMGLFEGNRRVKARIIETKFGCSWLMHEDETDIISRRGKKFLPVNWGEGRSRVLNGLGLSERDETAPAFAKIKSHGTGLSGCASAWVSDERAGCKWGQDATAI